MSGGGDPHPANSTAAIVVIRRCFIWLQLSILHEVAIKIGKAIVAALEMTCRGSQRPTFRVLCSIIQYKSGLFIMDLTRFGILPLLIFGYVRLSSHL